MTGTIPWLWLNGVNNPDRPRSIRNKVNISWWEWNVRVCCSPFDWPVHLLPIGLRKGMHNWMRLFAIFRTRTTVPCWLAHTRQTNQVFAHVIASTKINQLFVDGRNKWVIEFGDYKYANLRRRDVYTQLGLWSAICWYLRSANCHHCQIAVAVSWRMGKFEEKSIPIGRDKRTLEQERRDLIRGLDESQGGTLKTKSVGGQKSKSDRCGQAVRTHANQLSTGQWCDQLDRWIDETNKWWSCDWDRLWRNMFTLVVSGVFVYPSNSIRLRMCDLMCYSELRCEFSCLFDAFLVQFVFRWTMWVGLYLD